MTLKAHLLLKYAHPVRTCSGIAQSNTLVKYRHNRDSFLAATRLAPLLQHFQSSATVSRSYYFDTFKFVERLEKQGFTRKQSEAVMAALQKVISENMTDISGMMVSKAERDKAIYAYKVDFTQLRSEIQLLERKNNDFHLMKIETERLENELEKLKQKLREEISRNQAHVRLEMNLERGHVRDEASIQKLKLEETDTRIESEVAGLRTQMEATKFQILQYLMGSLTGAGALFLAYLRMFK